MNVEIGNIYEGDGNLRSVDKESPKYKNIVSNIRKNGLLNPIAVTTYERTDQETGEVVVSGYRIVDGLHRLTACLELGMEEIPVNVIDVADSKDLTIKQISGNLQRVETRPAEFAAKIKELLETDLTQTTASIADMLDVSVKFIEDRLSLNKLTPRCKQLVDASEINVAPAYKLAQLPPEEQEDWIDRARTADANIFRADVEARLKEIRQERVSNRTTGPAEFKPVPRNRKIADIQAEIENPVNVTNLLASNGVTDPVEAAKIALTYAISLDEPTQEAAKRDFETQQAKVREARERRTKENLAKKREAAEKKLEDLKKAEAEALAAAAE